MKKIEKKKILKITEKEVEDIINSSKSQENPR